MFCVHLSAARPPAPVFGLIIITLIPPFPTDRATERDGPAPLLIAIGKRTANGEDTIRILRLVLIRICILLVLKSQATKLHYLLQCLYLANLFATNIPDGNVHSPRIIYPTKTTSASLRDRAMTETKEPFRASARVRPVGG